MSVEVLSVNRLCAGYSGRPVIADVSFSLNAGEILCLVGESGCGKTTLLKAIMASQETQILSGDICLDGQPLSMLPTGARRRLCCRKVGMVFQTPEAAFNPIRSYRRQFIETLKSHGKYDRALFETQAAAALARVDLQDWRRILRACPFALSGGMNQRAVLALAMLLGQGVLLCDEPTSALDATVQLQVATQLKKMREDSGVALIVVTHSLALAQYLADTIGVMYAGRLVELGRASDVLHNPAHFYTKGLIRAVPGLDGQLPRGLSGGSAQSMPESRGCEFNERCPAYGPDCGSRAYAMREVGESHYASCPNGSGVME